MCAGQLQVIILHSKESGEEEGPSRRLHSTDQQPHVHVLDFYLKMPTGEMKKLRFPKQPKQASARCILARPVVVVSCMRQSRVAAAAEEAAAAVGGQR
jgi:hypothetical protein